MDPNWFGRVVVRWKWCGRSTLRLLWILTWLFPQIPQGQGHLLAFQTYHNWKCSGIFNSWLQSLSPLDMQRLNIFIRHMCEGEIWDSECTAAWQPQLLGCPWIASEIARSFCRLIWPFLTAEKRHHNRKRIVAATNVTHLQEETRCIPFNR